MAGRSDIEAGKAYVTLFVKNSLFVQGLNAAKKQLQSLGRDIMSIGGVLTGLGAALVSPLIAAVSQFTKIGSDLNDASARTGVAADNLAELDYAARQTGTSLATVEKALKFMAKSGKDVNDFDKVAAEISAIEDPSERAAAAMKAFGKGGTSLLPMLADLQELREQARQLGVVPTQAAVKMADAVGDAFQDVQDVVRATIVNLGAALAPALLPALTAVKNIAVWFNRVVQTSGEVIRSIALIGAGIFAAGAAVTGVGALIYGLGAAFGLVAGAAVTVASVLAGLLSPAALVVAALLGGVYAWIRFTESGQAAVAAVIAFFAPLLQTVRETLGGIADAFIAGDLGLAAQIAMTAVRLAFEAAMMPIAGLWYSLKLTVLTVLDSIRVAAIAVWGEIQAAMAGPVAFMGSLWETTTAYVVARFMMMAETAAAFWKAVGDGGALVGGALLEIFGSLEKVMNTFFATVGIGVVELAKQVAELAKMAPGAINFAVTQSSGLDVGEALGRAGEAATAAGQQARANADEANRQARTDAAIRREGRVGEGFNDRIERERRVAELQQQLDELNKQAAAAREQAGQGGGKNRGPDLSGLAEVKSNVSVGFSAAGLLAAAGGPQERIARGVEKLVQLQQRNNELQEQDDELEVDA